jgi:hypothetical protein
MGDSNSDNRSSNPFNNGIYYIFGSDQRFVRSVVGLPKGKVGDTLRYRADVSRDSIERIIGNPKTIIRWKIKVDDTLLELEATGEEIDLTIRNEWAGREIIVMAYYVASRENISARTRIAELCYCNRDFTVAEMRHIITQLRDNTDVRDEYQFDERGNSLYVDSDGTVIPGTDRGRQPENAAGRYELRKSMLDDIGTSLFTQNTAEPMPAEEATIGKFTAELNAAFSKYDITTCIRKIHFLAQAYIETEWFKKTYERSPSSSVIGGPFYRGRGLIQLTHDYNYSRYFNSSARTVSLREFIPKVAREMKYACDASGYYWKNLGVPGNRNISDDADRDGEANIDAVLLVTRCITGNVSAPLKLSERRKYTGILKEVMRYEDCINR